MAVRWPEVAKAALSASVVGVALLASVYAVFAPAGPDDYCRAIWEGSAFGLAQEGYKNWTGRWLAMTIHGAVLPRLDLQGWPYAATAFMWLALLFAIAFALASALTSAPRRQKLFMAAVAAASYWAGAPAIGEHVYWFTGAVENLLPLATGLGALLAAATRAKPAEPTWLVPMRLAASAVLGVMTCGLHELVGALLLGGLGLLLVHEARSQRWKRFGELAAVAAVVALGLASNVAAPGNAVRLGQIGGRLDFGHALRATFFEPDTSPSTWLFDARFWAIAAMVLTSDWFAKATAAWRTSPIFGFERPEAKAAAVLASGLAAAYAAAFLAAYLLGETTPGRVLDVCYAALFGAALFALVMIAPLARPSPSLNAIATGALALALITAPNTMMGVADLKLLAFDWRPATEQRDTLAREAAANEVTDTILLPEIPYGPRLYFWFPLADNEYDWNIWHNRCYAQYVGLNAVRSEPRTR
jgi:hypothetical protein